MKYSVDKKDDYAVLSLGEENLNSLKAPDLKAELIVLHNAGIKNLIMDLSQTKFVDSSGLSAILTGNRLWAESGNEFVLTGLVHPSVKMLITISRLASVLTIKDSLSEAAKFVMMATLKNELGADVLKSELFALWQLAKPAGLATPNIGTINDMICCPGGDYCSLANAKSIPVAEAIQRKFDDLDYVYDLGDLELNISGCMNACGHHHIGHIGILGVDKKGEEWYQIQLGGSANKNAALAKVLGRSLSRDAVVDSIEKLLDVYVENRLDQESFLNTYQRIGIEKFKERVYAPAS